MVELEFGHILRSGGDGTKDLVIKYPFRIRKIYSGAEKYEEYDRTFTVKIESTLRAVWGFTLKGEDNGEEKVLFEFALREIKRKKSLEELLNDKLEIILLRENQNSDHGFDQNKIPNPEGYTLTLDIDKPKMGF